MTDGATNRLVDEVEQIEIFECQSCGNRMRVAADEQITTLQLDGVCCSQRTTWVIARG